MERIHDGIAGHEFEPGPGTALADLDTLVAEVGATYPLLAYTAMEDGQDETSAMDSLILAGLVSP